MEVPAQSVNRNQQPTPQLPRTASEMPNVHKEPSQRSLMITQAGIIFMVAVILFVTIKYCTSVYFSREDVLTLALSCSQAALKRHQVDSWIQNGTLLGCRRISRFVVWDADLDIGVHSDDPVRLDRALTDVDNECFGYKASVRMGSVHDEYRTWRKCNNRICAQFHETAKTGEDLIVTGAGQAAASALFPLQSCVLAGVPTQCPADTVFFLTDSFGQEWLTVPLRYLFD